MPDSHEHLFFDCQFPKAVWSALKQVTKWGYIPDSWSLIVTHLCSMPHNNTIWSIINRLVMSATVYYIWQERNRRFHENVNRTPEEGYDLVCNAVKLRLLGLPMVKTVAVVQVARIWDLKVTSLKAAQ